MGSRPARRTAAALLIGICASLAPAQTDVVRTGRTFAVTIHPGACDDAVATSLADEALAAVEALRPLLDKWQVKPSSPPMVHVHVDAATFRAAEKTATGFAFPVEDFAERDGKAAHVLVWPSVTPDVLKAVGLPPSVAAGAQIAAAHAVALQVSEPARVDPWLAEIFAFGAFEALGHPGNKGGSDPLYDCRRIAYVRHHAAGNASSFAQIESDVRAVTDEPSLLLRHERAALTAQLCSAAGSSWAKKLLAKPPKPLAQLPHRAAVFESILGKDDAKVGHRFQAMLAGVALKWGYSQGAGRRGAQIVMIGGAKEPGELQAFAPPPQPPYTISGRVTLLAGKAPTLVVGLDDTEASVARVALHESGCTPGVFTRAAGKRADQGRAVAPIAVGKPFELRIDVSEEVVVHVDGQVVTRAKFPGRTFLGSWWAIVYDGAVALEGLRLDRPVAEKRR